MEGYKAAVINETCKILKKKKLFVSITLAVLAVIIGQIAVTAIKNGLGLRTAGSQEFPIVVLSFYVFTLLPLFSTFVAIDIFSSEFNLNTMKIALVRPISRLGLFCSKVTVIVMFILGNLIFVMLISFISGLLFNVVSSSVFGILLVVLAYLASFLPVFVFTLFVVLLTNILKGGLSVFFLSVLTFIGIYALGLLFPAYSSFLITSMFDWYILWLSGFTSFFKILREFLIMSGFGIMLFTAAYYLFDKKDI